MRHQFRNPTPADREAARVFSVRGGMLCGYAAPGTGEIDWMRSPDAPMPTPHYINTDDGATMGAMQEQVEDLAGCEVRLCDTWSGSIDLPPDGWIVLRRSSKAGKGCDHCNTIGKGGRTRGEALLSARMAFSSLLRPL